MEDVELTAQIGSDPLAPRPRARAWLWSPWYAKLWWGAIAAFWLSGLTVWLAGIRHLPFEAHEYPYLAVFLHPQTALLVLGLGYVRALFSCKANHIDEIEDQDAGVGIELFARDSFMDYLSDCGDTRSPLNSLNPANWRNREHRRH